MKIISSHRWDIIWGGIFGLFFFISCDEFLTPNGDDTLTKGIVFNDDGAAEAATTNLYSRMSDRGGFFGGYLFCFSFASALSSDELINKHQTVRLKEPLDQINGNRIEPDNVLLEDYWESSYEVIYLANANLEGLRGADKLSTEKRHCFLGEALFIRAYYYLGLIQTFGSVPLVLTTDYTVNRNLGRTSEAEIYEQIIADLEEAYQLLPEDYSAYFEGRRIRTTKGAASALLARVYLYLGYMSNAEQAATDVINNTSLYRLEDSLKDVFSITSKEAILQLWSDTKPNQASLLEPNSEGDVRHGSLTPSFLEGIESGDLRNDVWVTRTISQSTGEINFTVNKYRGDASPKDYSTLFRLAELYLIRAEALISLGYLAAARQDIDSIRYRAGLPLYADSTTLDDAALLKVIMRERRYELFTEGHRWVDLRRMELAEEILMSITYKEFAREDELYPIPEALILSTPALQGQQNPGYTD